MNNWIGVQFNPIFFVKNLSLKFRSLADFTFQNLYIFYKKYHFQLKFKVMRSKLTQI